MIDLGSDWSRTNPIKPNPLTGPGAWLRSGFPTPRPLLVVRGTRPSLLAAEAALARLDAPLRAGQATAPARLVVMAAWKRRGWPPGVIGAAGSRLSPLIEDAVVVPYDRQVELGGVTEELVSERVRAAVRPLLREWGLIGTPP